MPKSIKPGKSVTPPPLSVSRVRALGFGYSDPSAVGATLESVYGLRPVPVTPGGYDTGVVVMSLSGSQLLHNTHHLAGHMVCVFDRPDKLVRISGVQPVDFFFDGSLYRFKNYTRAALAPQRFPKWAEVKLESKPREVIKEMLDASDDGILNGILTFIYTIKNTKTRKDVTEVVYPWFFEASAPKKLFDILVERFPNVKFDHMWALFDEKADLVRNIRRAIKSYSLSQHPDFRAYCESQNVPFYDCHYLLKVVNAPKKEPKEPAAKPKA